MINLPEGFFAGELRKWDGCVAIFPDLERKEKEVFIPRSFREYAAINSKSKVVIIGCGEYFEVWNNERLREALQEAEPLWEQWMMFISKEW